MKRPRTVNEYPIILLTKRFDRMAYNEPNVKPSEVGMGSIRNGQDGSVQECMCCKFDRLFRTYAPTFLTEQVDKLHEKRTLLDAAVKEKVNKVFDTCERIVDYYIPDDSFERPVLENPDVFKRMGAFSHELSVRFCDRYLPFVKMEKTEEGEKRPVTESIKEPLMKVKEQCVETVKPVIAPLNPVLTPLMSLVVLVFSTLYLVLKTVVLDPVSYLYTLLQTYLTQVKGDFAADADGNYPIVGKATTAYNYVMDEVYPLFVDEEGKVTLKKFQELCQTKGAEYQRLVKEKVTEENLKAFLSKTETEVKKVVEEKMEPVRANEKTAKGYWEELVKVFSNEKGEFSVEKVKVMAGESGSKLKELLQVSLKKVGDSKDEVLKTASEKAKDVTEQVKSQLLVVRANAVSIVSVAMGLVLLFPTVCFLLGVFVLSLFIDIDEITPSPAMKKILSAIDTMEVDTKTEGSKTQVTIKYDDSKFENM